MKLLVYALLLLSVTAFAAEGDFNWNLRTAPIGWMVAPNLRADFKLAEQWTLGLAGNSLNRKIKAVQLNGNTGGLLLNYAFNSALANTWFIDAGVAYGDIKAEAKAPNGQLFTRGLHNTTAHLTTGYQWFWNHFNLALGAGADWNSEGDKYVVDASGNNLEKIPIREVAFATEASIGWAF